MTGIPSHLGNYHIDVSRLFQRVNKMVFFICFSFRSLFYMLGVGHIPACRKREADTCYTVLVDILGLPVRVKVCSLDLFWDPHTPVAVS